jgi:tRNA (cytidine/uridine-2'-O-)-methyltransferase
LGFRLDDRQLKRAGLDYHEYATVRVHSGWTDLLAALPGRRFFAFSTRGTRRYDTVKFAPADVLVFGPETRGLPDETLATFAPERRLTLPMVPGNRSLNLSNTVAVAVFEAWRQNGYEGSMS